VTLREEGFKGRIVLIGREPGVPFGRPPLSKTYLRSEEDLDGWYVKPPGWYRTHEVELRRATVSGVDVDARVVVLESGQQLDYHKPLLATGGRNRRLTVPGADLRGIYQLRTVADCDAVKHEARPNRSAVVVGMGFVGCEVAASLTQLGVRVTAIFPQRAPLEKVLRDALGAAFAAIHQAKGVELRPQDQIARLEGTDRVARSMLGSSDPYGTSTPSGQTNTSTSSSTPATRRSGIGSLSVGPSRSGSWSASICWTGKCWRPSDLTAG
jgi:3-phenylpropionate/trans-cinnamate dioxygenase ferredoxin reductase component